MKVKTSLSTIFICIILAIGVPFAKAESDHKPYAVSIYTLTAGSTTHLFGVALADLINKHSKWLKATAIEGMNPTMHQRMLAQEPEKRANTVVFSTPASQWMLETGRMKGVKPYFGHKQLACWGVPANSFISLDPKITTFDDLKGKKVGVDLKRFFGRSKLALYVVEQYVPLDQIQIEYLPPTAGFNALRDGLIDAYYGMGMMISVDKATPSSPTLAFLGTVRDKPYFLSASPEKIQVAMKAIGGYPNSSITVAPGTYHPKQDVPWTLIVGTLTWGVDSAMPDDVAHEIARIHYQYHKRFAELHPSGAFISKDTVGLMGVTEKRVHPGALKYYKNEGIKMGALGWAAPDW